MPGLSVSRGADHGVRRLPRGLRPGRRRCTKAREMGSYRLVERLGKGGMGEVWRAQHRMLARPAAIKLIRPEMLGARDSGQPGAAAAALRARGAGHGAHAVAAHDGALRLRRHRRRHLLLRDGAAGRVRPRRAGRAVRAAAGGARRAPPPAGLRLARRGARGRAHPPRHQARQPLRLPVRPRGGLHQGAGLRAGEAGRAPEEDAAGSPPRCRAGGTPAFMSPEQALGDGGWTGGATSTPSAASPTGCSPGRWCSRERRRWRRSCCT